MKKRKSKSRVGRKKVNLLLLWSKLTERVRKAIVFALRRKGYLTQYLNWEIAAATAPPSELMLMDRDVVRAALRELIATPDAASFHPAAYDALRKLRRPLRIGMGV